MKFTLDHVVEESQDIFSFFFEPSQKLSFTAGQYIEMSLPHEHPDNRGVRRWFTISSSPTEPLVSITTRIIEKSSSFKKTLFGLEPGDEVSITGPMGDFVLPKFVQTPLIFVAGGIGITPFHSIMSWLNDTKETRPIRLIYGVRSEEEIIFNEAFDKADIHPTVVVENPSSAWGGERGRLSAELILGLAKPSEDSLIYVSGPEPMVETLEKDLKSSGINKDNLVLDFFPNYKEI
ncbi:MAG TPA: FAD-dependent oxidoreductase [Candidatus Saccharimonadales bacterium]|nr:FAD-dependent oxidoreductase [Candidatus Saccharimonadales bacterium]